MKQWTKLNADILKEVAAREDPVPATELLPLVYQHLRHLASEQLARESPGQTLQTTALVHEAWMRVVGDEDPGWQCRAHFFGAAARAMRQILIQQARRKARLRHGGAWSRADIDADSLSTGDEPSCEDLIVIDDALDQLEAEDPVQAQIVMLRFFTGLDMGEIASMLGLPLRRIEREWRFARSWLQRRLSRNED